MLALFLAFQEAFVKSAFFLSFSVHNTLMSKKRVEGFGTWVRLIFYTLLICWGGDPVNLHIFLCLFLTKPSFTLFHALDTNPFADSVLGFLSRVVAQDTCEHRILLGVIMLAL